MKVILIKDVKGVGQRFEEKNISDGYANNLLIPKGLAVVADKAGLARVKQLKEQAESKRREENARLEEKQTKRQEKHAALEKFRQESRSQSSS
jgi:large subunit ribosomal protein L9